MPGKDKIKTTGYIMKYKKKTPASRSIEADQEATRIRRQNERERSGYIILRNYNF